jgi:hypothetical protein
MKTVCTFTAKFASLIGFVLHCFDRVIFKGHLPVSRPSTLEHFVDQVLKVRRCDFLKKIAPQWSERLVDHAKQFAQHYGRPYAYRPGKFAKDEWAMQIVRQDGISEGLIGIVCVQETCPTFQLVTGAKRPGFGYQRIPQRVLYYYFLDRHLGLMHVRVQTWAPFTCQVYVNGHDYVAHALARRQLGFVQQDNAFLHLDDSAAAQQIADRFVHLNWPKILDRYLRRVNPLLGKELDGMSAYWVIDQAEFASDLVFANPQALSGLYSRLLEYAWLTFTPKNLLAFFGRKEHRRFDGEVLTACKTERQPGARIKHRLKNNWLKMYDKFGRILRVETVINQPGEFRVYRQCRHQDGTTSMGWYAMPKGVGNLHHYHKHALACNQRYLEALAVVDDPAPGYQDLRLLTEAQVEQERSYAGFNPVREEDTKLFAAVLDGDHLARGFRNGDIRVNLYGQAKDRQRRHRQSAAVGRLLKRLHVRGLVAKVPHTRRWKVTKRGRQILGDVLRVYRRYAPQAA